MAIPPLSQEEIDKRKLGSPNYTVPKPDTNLVISASNKLKQVGQNLVDLPKGLATASAIGITLDQWLKNNGYNPPKK